MEDKEIEILKATRCPGCGLTGGIKEIIYGMPTEDFEYEKYISGGCCIEPDNPTHGCVGCGWEGEAY
jgi:hypothetical protein